MNWFRKACARVYDGSVVIGWRMARWPWESAAFWSRFRRVGSLLFLAWGTWRLTGAYPRFTAVFIGGFLIAAYREGQPPPPPAAEPEPEPLSEREVFLAAVLEWIGDRNGIHLGELHQRLTARTSFDWLTRPHLSNLLATYQVPTRQMRVGDVGGRYGIARDDVVRLLAAPPNVDQAEEPPVEPLTCDVDES